MNARFVQAIFDDSNPKSRHLWAYADGPFDTDRNTAGFVAQLLSEVEEEPIAGTTIGRLGHPLALYFD
jgi:hypothetical protein